MKTRLVGASGLQVSAVGLGTNGFGTRLGLHEARSIVDECEDLGVTLLDTADLYGEGESERIIGRLLAGRRDRFVVATKVGLPWEDGSRPGGLDPAYIRNSVQGSLKRLSMDHIDLLQLHVLDPRVPMADVLEVLDELVAKGLVRHVGCSNFRTWEVVEWVLTARYEGWPQFVSVQTEYSMLVRDAETELLSACQRLGVGLIPYRPLAQGFLAGKYRRGERPPEGSRLALQQSVRMQRETEQNWHAVEAVRKLAETKGCTPAQLAIAWLINRTQVSSVIAGASNRAQLADNARASDIDLFEGDLEILERVLPPVPGGAVGSMALRTYLLGG